MVEGTDMAVGGVDPLGGVPVTSDPIAKFAGLTETSFGEGSAAQVRAQVQKAVSADKSEAVHRETNPAIAVARDQVERLEITPLDSGEQIFDSLDPTRKQQAIQLAQSVNIKNNQAALQFGLNIQRQFGKVTDKALDTVRNADTGHIGELLRDFTSKLNEIDANGLPRTPEGKVRRFISNIPILGRAVPTIERHMMKFGKVRAQLENIAERIAGEKDAQYEHFNRLDELYKDNDLYFKQLELVLATGELKLKEIDEEFRKRKIEAKISNDMQKMMEVKDIYDLREAFRRRMHNLNLAYSSALTSGPAIRVAQEGAKSIIEFADQAVTFTIPEWKKQFVIGLALYAQRQGLKVFQEAARTTDELVKANAQMLYENQMEIKAQQGRGYVDVDALVEVNVKLAETLKAGLALDRENEKKRQEGRKKLAESVEKLKEAMAEAGESILSAE